MLSFRNKYAANGQYSQNGEQGIIDEIIRRIRGDHWICGGRSIRNETFINVGCIEYGAHNGKYCSNTRHLLEKGWSGLMIEPTELYHELVENKRGLDCVVMQTEINPGNVGELPYCFLLSIDTDGSNDYFCFQALPQSPAIVIIEINSSISPERMVVDDQIGASYSAMLALGILKGYFLACHTGNMVFVRSDFKQHFPEIPEDATIDQCFDTKWIKK